MAGRAAAGAVVCFTGHVRGFAKDKSVNALELDHYSGYTESEIAKIRDTAHRRWPGIESLIIHRYGRMIPGEPIVFVAVTSEHRQAVFEAATYLMDHLKTSAPFWKKEIRSDGTVWIEPTDADYAAGQDRDNNAGD
ncbi:MAG: molybdenum cofactor biosynthesis protein MoaE [Hyphomonadaceae bacterium]|nr:molybdenum cofactor biosynthesis protein MoaE [Hyphomonadaceae bacterium]MBC6412676.1 molybdenum cofactor biosynthesis protein MoaE [Hyphomonadaceae bacterium]